MWTSYQMGDCCVEPLRNELEGLNQAVTEKEEEANRMSQMISQLEKNIATYKEEYAQLIAIKNDLKHDMFKTKLIAVCLNLIYNLPSR